MGTKLMEASTEEICDLLLENGFDRSVAGVFRDKKIDGAVLVDLDKDDMKELGISALGDRKKLQQLINQLKNSQGSADFCMLAGSTRGVRNKLKSWTQMLKSEIRNPKQYYSDYFRKNTEIHIT